MRKTEYFVMDPSGNVTLLAEWPEGLGPREMAKLGAALLKAEPLAEQAGFVRDLTGEAPELYMAGGEFCGNASLCAGALRQLLLQSGGEEVLSLRVSGAKMPVPLRCAAGEENWSCRLEMPRALGTETVSLPFRDGRAELPLVRFPGIGHVILREMLPRREAETLIRDWCRELGTEALGLMFYEEETSRLTPLVYVPDIPSLYWESSCASGSAALGLYLEAEGGVPVKKKLQEPGGCLEIETDGRGRVWLAGRVNLLSKGSFSWKEEEL